MKNNPTTRFSNTVEYYVKYRPSYPQSIITFLQDKCGISTDKLIADIGSGTGIFTKLLLDNHYKVIAIEPNNEMREKAEWLLSSYPNFKSSNATAENTELEDHSIDVITAATAFHWFDRVKTHREFFRILKPSGWCILLWNLRRVDASPLMNEYENLLQKYGIDYVNVAAEKLDEKIISEFYLPIKVGVEKFSNMQRLDWAGFQGRILSTSYTPKPGHPNFDSMLQAAKKIFDQNQDQGYIEFFYTTKLYYGRLSAKQKE